MTIPSFLRLGQGKLCGGVDGRSGRPRRARHWMSSKNWPSRGHCHREPEIKRRSIIVIVYQLALGHLCDVLF